ncbi:hypothetical protein AUP68_11985 [Ilyonectria robusta]
MRMRSASGGLRGPPGPRSGGLRPEDLPAGALGLGPDRIPSSRALRPGPDRIPSSRPGSRSRYRKIVSYITGQIPTVPIRLSDNPDQFK